MQQVRIIKIITERKITSNSQNLSIFWKAHVKRQHILFSSYNTIDAISQISDKHADHFNYSKGKQDMVYQEKILKFYISGMARNASKWSTMVGENFEIYMSEMAKNDLKLSTMIGIFFEIYV